jgi:hypothetical protein
VELGWRLTQYRVESLVADLGAHRFRQTVQGVAGLWKQRRLLGGSMGCRRRLSPTTRNRSLAESAALVDCCEFANQRWRDRTGVKAPH